VSDDSTFTYTVSSTTGTSKFTVLKKKSETLTAVMNSVFEFESLEEFKHPDKSDTQYLTLYRVMSTDPTVQYFDMYGQALGVGDLCFFPDYMTGTKANDRAVRWYPDRFYFPCWSCVDEGTVHFTSGLFESSVPWECAPHAAQHEDDEEDNEEYDEDGCDCSDCREDEETDPAEDYKIAPAIIDYGYPDIAYGLRVAGLLVAPDEPETGSDKPAWVTGGQYLHLWVTETSSINASDGIQAWGVDPQQFSPPQAMADYYLLEAISHGIPNSPGRALARDASLLILNDEAASMFNTLVRTHAGPFARYLDAIVGGELRHHSIFKRGVGGYRYSGHPSMMKECRHQTWAIWHHIRSIVGTAALHEASRLFSSFGSSSNIGGPRWRTFSDLLISYETGKITDAQFLDRLFTLQHNGGSVFNKVTWAGEGLQVMSTKIGPAHSQAPEPDWPVLLRYGSPEVNRLFADWWGAANKARRVNGLPYEPRPSTRYRHTVRSLNGVLMPSSLNEDWAPHWRACYVAANLMLAPSHNSSDYPVHVRQSSASSFGGTFSWYFYAQPGRTNTEIYIKHLFAKHADWLEQLNQYDQTRALGLAILFGTGLPACYTDAPMDGAKMAAPMVLYGKVKMTPLWHRAYEWFTDDQSKWASKVYDLVRDDRPMPTLEQFDEALMAFDFGSDEIEEVTA